MPNKKCPNNTFNDGSYYFCQKCSSCEPGFTTVDLCNTNADTKCEATRNGTTEVPMTARYSTTEVPMTTNLGTTELQSASWQPALIICTILVVLSALAIWIKKRRVKTGQITVLENRRPSHVRAMFTPVLAAPKSNQLEDILSPNILAAPLQSVLDNLDVLEELVILLDPETQGIKNTKHLASFCSFSANWVTYTYSMKDSKSPLKAVLEGVTCRHPEWTVRHLAELLRQIKRMDAIAVLSKLRPYKLEIIDV